MLPLQDTGGGSDGACSSVGTPGRGSSDVMAGVTAASASAKPLPGAAGCAPVSESMRFAMHACILPWHRPVLLLERVCVCW